MIRALTQGRSLMILLGLGLVLVALVACGGATATATPEATQPSTGQVGQQSNTGGFPVSQASLNELAALARDGFSISAGAPGYVGPSAVMNTGIWVTGRGEATAAPDLAILSLGVEAFENTVQQASSEAATAIDQVISALRANGIAEKDIQTRFFNIFPRYNREGRDIVGYQVTNQLTVKVRNLDSIGAIIDEAAEAGGDSTRFQSINFTIEDTKALQDQARTDAVADLMDKANQFATLTGSQLGQLLYITESGGFVSSPVFDQRVSFENAAAAPQTSIMTGELDVVVTVQAVFAIQQPSS